MKRIFVTAFFTLLAFTACEQVDGPADVPTGEGTMTISVDKTQIESDGKDIATFTIKDANGNILTTEANKGIIFFKNVANGSRLPRYSTGFTSIVDGEFEFVGIYNGMETSNSVRIKAQNRASYELYHRNVAVFKLTGTWCSNCPRMTDALHALDDDAMNHSIVLACHSEEKGHPFYVNYNGADLASGVFRHMNETSGVFPTNCYDLVSLNTSSSTITIADEIMKRRIDSPAGVGVKISSVRLEDNAIKVDAAVKASAAGTYDMVCLLVADNLKYEGGYTNNDDGLYSNVILAVSGDNLFTYGSRTKFNLEKDAESVRSFEFKFASAPSSALLDNMRAVILVHRQNADGSSEVNNCAECAFGETLDYMYN